MADENTNQNENKNENNNTATEKVTVDVTQEIMNKIRSDVKNQYIGEIDKLKGEKKDLETRVSEHDKVKNELETTKTELEKVSNELKGVKTSMDEKDTKIKELTDTINKMTTDMQQLSDKLVLSQKEVENMKNEVKIKAYRESKITELKIDESVVDLIQGTTEQEIDAAIKVAQATYEKIAAKFGNNQNQNNQNTNQNQNQNTNQNTNSNNTNPYFRPGNIPKLPSENAKALESAVKEMPNPGTDPKGYEAWRKAQGLK